ncbi:sulfatase [Sphingobacterium chuzhouense]|uniref:Sulfatase n=1 Tax=Sphingobacterium chuzhouense TaxID=1742264 RepID=A0ABR7XNW2_9SPHI|nr:sulfatase [Sphingobacterium chuzhouense]MBD1420869.1 sulfatase [Sphingobacterium chuzhouense]
MKYLIFACSLLFVLQTAAQSNRQEMPNILMIAVDDLNDFIGAMGNPDAITPNIDKLASQGVTFTNAHCQAPLCGPSRASIMTGLRPSSTGIYGMIADNEIKDVNMRTQKTPFLHEHFKEAGYYLLGVGKIFHQHFPDGLLDEDGGKSEYGPLPEKRFKWDKKGTATDWGAFPTEDIAMPDDYATAWAVEKLSQQYDKPFFLSVGLIRPHVPWYVPQKWFDLYDPQKLHLPAYLPNDKADLPDITKKIDDWPMMPTTEWAIEHNEWRNILQAYLACVSYADHNIGRILDALRKSKYAENTIVVLWSDHGYRLGEKNTFAKVSLWDRATKAPLIFSGAGVPEGEKRNQAVELLDIYPTLTDLAGLTHNALNEGSSLVPLMKNDHYKWNKPAITSWGRNNTSIKTKDYRFIKYEDGSKELYDIKKDPNEWNNLAGEAKYAKVMKRLEALLPKDNVPWSDKSFYNANEYFRNKGLK